MTTNFKNNFLKHTIFFLVTNLFIIQFLSENGFRNYFDIDLWHHISFVTFNDIRFTEPSIYNLLKQSPAFTVQIFEFIQKYIPNLLDKNVLYLQYLIIFITIYSIIHLLYNFKVNLSLKESSAYRRCKNTRFLFLYSCYKYFGLVHKQLAYYYQNDRMLDMNKAVPNLDALLSIRDLKRFNQKNIIAKNNKYFLVYLSNK